MFQTTNQYRWCFPYVLIHSQFHLRHCYIWWWCTAMIHHGRVNPKLKHLKKKGGNLHDWLGKLPFWTMFYNFMANRAQPSLETQHKLSKTSRLYWLRPDTCAYLSLQDGAPVRSRVQLPEISDLLLWFMDVYGRYNYRIHGVKTKPTFHHWGAPS